MVTAPAFCSTAQFSRRITQPGWSLGWVTKLVEGFMVVYISTSITKALAPHCLQNSGSGTARSSCSLLAMLPWEPDVLLVSEVPMPMPMIKMPASTAIVAVLKVSPAPPPPLLPPLPPRWGGRRS